MSFRRTRSYGTGHRGGEYPERTRTEPSNTRTQSAEGVDHPRVTTYPAGKHTHVEPLKKGLQYVPSDVPIVSEGTPMLDLKVLQELLMFVSPSTTQGSPLEESSDTMRHLVNNWVPEANTACEVRFSPRFTLEINIYSFIFMSIPRHSMYVILAYIGVVSWVNVGTYSSPVEASARRPPSMLPGSNRPATRQSLADMVCTIGMSFSKGGKGFVAHLSTRQTVSVLICIHFVLFFSP